MYYAYYSLPDNILHYVYFNCPSLLSELAKNILKSSETTILILKDTIETLKNEHLIASNGLHIEITSEGKKAVENFASYDAYISKAG